MFTCVLAGVVWFAGTIILEVLNGLIEKCVRENAATAQDQTEYNKRYRNLTGRYEALLKKQGALEQEREARVIKADALDGYMIELSDLEELELEFKAQRWNALVERVAVYQDGRLVFQFKGGNEVTVNMK